MKGLKVRSILFIAVLVLASFYSTYVYAVEKHSYYDVFKVIKVTGQGSGAKATINAIEPWEDNPQVIFIDGSKAIGLVNKGIEIEAELIDESAEISVVPMPDYTTKGLYKDNISVEKVGSECIINFSSSKGDVQRQNWNKPAIIPIHINYEGEEFQYYIVVRKGITTAQHDLMLANADTGILLDEGYIVKDQQALMKYFTVDSSVKEVSLEALQESISEQTNAAGNWMADGEIYARINGGDYKRIPPSGEKRGQNLSTPFELKAGINFLEVSYEPPFSTNTSYYINNKAQGNFKEGITNNSVNNNLFGTIYHYLYVINKTGELGASEKKGSDVSVAYIDAQQLGASNVSDVPWTVYSIEKTSDDEYILALPEQIGTSSGEVYNKVIMGIMPNDPDATVEFSNYDDVAGDRWWVYQAVKVADEEGNYKDFVKFKVTAADGKSSKEYTVRITHASANTELEGLSFEDAVLKDYTSKEKTTFTNDKHVYLLQTDNDSAHVKIQKPEGSTILVNGKTIDEEKDGVYLIDTSSMATILQIKAADLLNNQNYYFVKQKMDGSIPLQGQTDKTITDAKRMLTGWNSRSELQKKNLSDSYWSYYMTAATDLPLDHTVAYDVTKHPFNYGSDAASVVMELVMTGNNPYNYNGVDYVKKLKEFKNNNSYGPFAADTWTLMAFRMCGEPVDDTLIKSVTGTAKSVNGGDIRPWALAALSNWDKVSQEDIVAMALEMKGTLHNDGLWGNAYTNGCYLTGIGASGVNIDYYSTDKGTFLDQYAKIYMTEDYKFSYVGEEDKYVKDAIIGLGDLIHERSIWASYALTNDKMKQLIDQAKSIDLAGATDEQKTALNQAIDAAEAVQNNETGYGQAYYALQEAMKQVDDSYNLHVRLCSWDQSQQIDKLMADIDDLAGKELTLASASDIKEVTDSYKTLTEEDQRFAGYVENASKLDQIAENYAKLIDGAIVKADESSEKGKLVSKENTAAIEEIKAALDSITEDQKKNVKNIEVFNELEKTYADAVSELINSVDMAMTKVSEDTSDGTVVSKEASESIETIKTELEKLTEDQQKQIAGLDSFKSLDEVYAAKVGEIVAAIDEAITTLKESSKDGTIVNQTNTAAVADIKAKLDMLTESQQEAIAELDTFTALDVNYADAVEKAIKSVDDAIAKLDGTSKGGTVVSKESTKAIDEINKALDALTEEQKDNLTNAGTFASLQPAYKEAVAKEVKALEDEISELQKVNSEEMTDEEKASVSETLKRLDNLTEEQQKDINNLAALKPYEDVVRAEAANAAINALPDSVTSLSQKEAVEAAREAYDKLSKEAIEKLKAMNPDAEKKLQSAEAAIKALENGEKPQAEEKKNDSLAKVGQKVTVSGLIYKVTASSNTKKTVSLIGTKSKKISSLSVPSAITIKKARYNVTAIAGGAVKKRTKLKKVVIGNNVTSIGGNAFYGCKNLKKVTIGTKITVISGKAFYGCKKLKKIVIRSTVLKKVGGKAFAGIYKKAVIKVPKSKKKLYKKILKGKGQKKTVKIK